MSNTKPLSPSRFIPDFNELFDRTYEFILFHQGEKGYIETTDPNWDTIYGFDFPGDNYGLSVECKVYGVRAKDGDIEAIMYPITTEDGEPNECENPPFDDDTEWSSIRWSDVAFVPTLIAIAENIWEFVSEPDEVEC